MAVGDGANDVAMIRGADIGIGLLGKEGRQAARARCGIYWKHASYGRLTTVCLL